MQRYNTGRVAPTSRNQDTRAIPVLYIPGLIKPHFGSCSGLRTAAPSSEIRVFDAVTNELKRIISPDGKKVIKEFAQ